MNSPLNVLVVEDDDVVGQAIKSGMEQAGHTCDWSRDGQSGFDLAQANQYDAIVLDRLLPTMNGIHFIQRLRDQGNSTPILMLSAIGSVEDRIEGLDAGADDYLVKPFALAELLARLIALSRRSAASGAPKLAYQDLTINLDTRRVYRGETELDLTPTELSILEFLLRHSEKIVTRRMLCEHLWTADWEGVTNVVEVHISRLRSKVDRQFAQPLIHTVRGQGYRLGTA